MNETEGNLVNRVAQSGLITLRLEEFYPEGEVVPFDMKPYLFREMLLKEKEFRQVMKQHDWSQYAGKNIAVYCSNDAIIPVWAFMLIVTHAASFATRVMQCLPEDFVTLAMMEQIAGIDAKAYEGKKLVIKGCGDKPVPAFAYAEITSRLLPYAQSIMYGEPCSTVPVYKRPREK